MCAPLRGSDMTFAPSSGCTTRVADRGTRSQSASFFFNSSASRNWVFGRRFGLIATNCLIGQPLALEALKRGLGAHGVIHPQFFAGVLSEIKLRDVAVKVLGLDMLVGAEHP